MAKLSAPKKPTAKAAPKKPTSRSKTGNAACSEAASNWQLSLRGKAALSPDTYKTLAKCRSLNRAGKMAEAQGRTGKLSEMGEAAVKGRLQARFDSGLITQKARTEKLNLLLKQRSERGNAVVAKSATTEAAKQKNPWDVSRKEYEANVMPKPSVQGQDAELFRKAQQGMDKFNAIVKENRATIYPTLNDLGITNRDRTKLVKLGLIDKTSNTLTIQGRLESLVMRGENPWLGGPIKTHKQLVQDAIAAGKPIPAPVLAEYPDLKPTPPKPVEAKLGYSLGGKLAPGRGTEARKRKADSLLLKRKLGNEDKAIAQGAVPLSMRKTMSTPKGFEVQILKNKETGQSFVKSVKPIQGLNTVAIQIDISPPKGGKFGLMDPISGRSSGLVYKTETEAKSAAKRLDRITKRAERETGQLSVGLEGVASGKAGNRYQSLMKRFFNRQLVAQGSRTLR